MPSNAHFSIWGAKVALCPFLPAVKPYSANSCLQFMITCHDLLGQGALLRASLAYDRDAEGLTTAHHLPPICLRACAGGTMRTPRYFPSARSS